MIRSSNWTASLGPRGPWRSFVLVALPPSSWLAAAPSQGAAALPTRLTRLFAGPLVGRPVQMRTAACYARGLGGELVGCPAGMRGLPPLAPERSPLLRRHRCEPAKAGRRRCGRSGGLRAGLGRVSHVRSLSCRGGRARTRSARMETGPRRVGTKHGGCRYRRALAQSLCCKTERMLRCIIKMQEPDSLCSNSPQRSRGGGNALLRRSLCRAKCAMWVRIHQAHSAFSAHH
jgi:hypothetical protein